MSTTWSDRLLFRLCRLDRDSEASPKVLCPSSIVELRQEYISFASASMRLNQRGAGSVGRDPRLTQTQLGRSLSPQWSQEGLLTNMSIRSPALSSIA